jgi:hypothetical protein
MSVYWCKLPNALGPFKCQLVKEENSTQAIFFTTKYNIGKTSSINPVDVQPYNPKSPPANLAYLFKEDEGISFKVGGKSRRRRRRNRSTKRRERKSRKMFSFI